MKTMLLPVLKKFLLVSIPGCVVLFSFLTAPQPVFIIPMLALLLLWTISYSLQGIYQAADIPVLFLLLGTFALGRAFSLIGVNVGNLPLYVTEMCLAASLALLLLKGKVLWAEWESPLPKGLAVVLAVYFLMGTLYLIIGVMGKAPLALRDIVFCHYMLFLFITLSLLTKPGKIKSLMSFFIPAVIIVFFIGLVSYFLSIGGSPFRQFIKEFKMTSLALSCGLMIMLGLSFFAFFNKKMKWVTGIVVYLAFLFLIMSEVRAAWLGLIAALILLAILLKKEFKIIILIFLLLAASLFIIDHFQLAINKNKIAVLKEQVKSVGHQSFRSVAGANIRWRLDIWKQTIDEILEHPVFGWGYGIQIDYLVWEKRLSLIRAMGGSTGILPPHNHVLAVAYKMGLVGLALFLFINFRIFFYGLCYLRKCKSQFNRRFLIAALAGLVYWHSMAFFFDILESPPTGIFLWVLLGCILGIVYVDRNLKTNHEVHEGHEELQNV